MKKQDWYEKPDSHEKTTKKRRRITLPIFNGVMGLAGITLCLSALLCNSHGVKGPAGDTFYSFHGVSGLAGITPPLIYGVIGRAGITFHHECSVLGTAPITILRCVPLLNLYST